MKNLLVMFLAASLALAGACGQAPSEGKRATVGESQGEGKVVKDPKRDDKVVKTEKEWKAELTPEQFRVLRQAGTERAFTGAYWDNKAEGVYVCAGCELPLYSSKTKFKSGTGWPSFYEAVSEDALIYAEDRSSWGVRTELRCARCDGHLGHVFKDAYDQPGGMRHCINSVSLKFVPKEEMEEKQTATEGRRGE